MGRGELHAGARAVSMLPHWIAVYSWGSFATHRAKPLRQVSMNPKNTPFEIKRLLGRRFKDPQVQADLARLPFKVRSAV